MSSEPTVISVRGLGKAYDITKNLPRPTTLAEATMRLLRWPRASLEREAFWALRDVSFDIAAGERVGIIGANGAGKSTLLRILTRVTNPTEGQARLRGRVGSLLEVGTGFHAELTGRENVFLNGAILGMTRRQVTQQIASIAAFAGVEEFLDTPVKRYSSGMFTRLAFAVAAHLDTDILLVDEVLAVGDAAFQKKCLGRMRTVSEEGRTILFVSHNLTALGSLCERAIWLRAGHLVQDGPSQEVVRAYLRHLMDDSRQITWDEHLAPKAAGVTAVGAEVTTPANTEGTEITMTTPVDIRFAYRNTDARAQLNVNISLHNGEGVCVLASVSAPGPRPVGIINETCCIPAGLLNNGPYSVSVLLVRDSAHPLLSLPGVLSFNVQEEERTVGWYGRWPGVVRPTLDWRMERISA